MACLNCQHQWGEHTLDNVKDCLNFYAERLYETTKLYVKELEKND